MNKNRSNRDYFNYLLHTFPLGSVSQRAGVPQLPGNYLDKSAAGSFDIYERLYNMEC